MKYNKIFRILAMAVVLSLLLIALPASPALAAESLDVSPNEAAIGDKVTLTGSDYTVTTSGKKVYIYFASQELDEGDDIEDLEDYEQTTTYAGAQGDPEPGEIRKTFTIPDVLDEGDEEEVVHGGEYFFYTTYSTTGDIEAKDKFTVFGITQVDPVKGTVGTEVEIEGVFDDDEDIEVFYDGDEVDIASGDDKTESDGDFKLTIIIPESPAGDHTIKVEVKNDEEEATFTVEPKSAISATSGMIGDRVTVSGTGFGDTDDVTVTFGGEQVATGKTDSKGSFSINFDVPGVAAGTYDVEVEDADGNKGTTYTFTLTTDVSISPVTTQASPGHIGMDVTISGDGFIPDHEITITYTSTPVKFTTTSEADGSFSYTFKVPKSEPGEHTITATDGTNTLEVTFFMESQAPPTPQLLLPEMDTKPEQPVHFTWQGVTDPSGVTYVLLLARDRNFTDIVFEKELTKPEYPMTETEDEALESTKKEAPYWWGVKAIDGAGNESLWSSARSFSIGFVFALPSWALYLLIGVGGLLLFFIGFFVGRRTIAY